ncbi:MAG: HAD-IB family hydrolase [Microcoleus vaginatus WJT46-NPBG5]|jgi:HAD superfamily hydrolase (TIGR01490 family)|nr:HAD-IB family hydrolase [Microcoleus vaginatus WJT46-NPBG5]
MEVADISLPTQNRPIVAVFDFDGTLTKKDSFLPFLCGAVGQFRYLLGLLVLLPWLMGLALKIIPNGRVKEAFLTHFLGGWSEEKLQRVAERFAVQKIPKMLRPEALRRLEWHQAQGHKLVVLSASPEAYLVPWAQTISVDMVIASRLEVQTGLLTGRLLGKNCYGQEKVERLKAGLGNLSDYCLYAYGDSAGDLQLLAIADYPYYRNFGDTKIAR